MVSLLLRQAYGRRLSDARHGQLHIAAAIIAGVLGGLLILDLGIDDALQVSPVDGLPDAAAVDEHSRCPRDVEFAGFLYFGIDFGFGGFVVDAEVDAEIKEAE